MPDHTTSTPQKTCSKCGETKPATSEYFNRAKSGKYGLRSHCNVCRIKERVDNKENIAERRRAYQAANKEEIRKRDRARRLTPSRQKWESEYRAAYREANKDRLREYDRERNQNPDRKEYQREKYRTNPEPQKSRSRKNYHENRDTRLEYHRKRYINNHEQYKIRIQRYQLNNPEKVRVWHNTRRARKRNAEGSHTAEDIQRQYKAQHGKCYYCGAKVGDTYHLEHVIPLSRGGSNGPENIVIACPPCNLSKSDKLPSEWVQGGRLL